MANRVRKTRKKAARDARARHHALMGGHRPIGHRHSGLPALKENPISTTTWVVGGVAVLGIAGLIYYLTTKSTTSSSGSGGTPPVQSSTVILQDGAQSVRLPASGITLALPPGATWLTAFGTVGSSAPVIITAGEVASIQTGTGTLPVTWMLNGVMHTTDLTLTVGT